AEVNKQKNEAAWKSINVLSAILVACAPIPGIGPLLGLIGLGLLAINPVREGLTYLYNKFSKENKSTPESQPESEFQSAANDPTYSTSAGMQAALSNARKTEPSRQPTREITPVETLSEPEPKQSLAQRFWSFWSSSTAELPQSQESQKQNNRQGENNQKIR
ncbi:MAG: hypothetical protein K0S63_114, partial [Gammaproteobacteria bacterium]|nr:hypothetical protein [Gammaproteobacteria bacterium]